MESPRWRTSSTVFVSDQKNVPIPIEVEMNFDTPLTYFELRGEAHDERIISESLFYTGLIHENKELSNLEYFEKAQTLASSSGIQRGMEEASTRIKSISKL